MIWFLLAIGLAVLMAYDLWLGYDSNIIAILKCLGMSIVFSLFASVLFIALSFILGTAPIAHQTESKYQEICALKDNDSASGSFFLGTGSIDSEPKYFYIIETERGLKQQCVNADKAYIQYTDGQPTVEQICATEPDNKWWYLIGYPIFEPEYIFYIPEGTVTTEFSIDLE